MRIRPHATHAITLIRLVISKETNPSRLKKKLNEVFYFNNKKVYN